MSEMAYWLPVVWACVLAIGVAWYVVADGFDLGVGILFPTAADEDERDRMMNSIAPFWDGNETWLVLGGGGLFLAFPKAYAAIAPALYIPLIVMLLGLIFRGVSFEFRFVSKPNNRVWDVAFWLGSLVATICQGLVLGGFIQGIQVGPDLQFAGGPFDWLTPFSVLCAFGLVTGYALLGAAWLMMKAEGDLAHRSQTHARIALLAVLVFVALVSLWTPVSFERIAERWFSVPNIYYLWPVPLVTALVAFITWRGIERGSGGQAFIGTIILFLLCFLGLGISLFPHVVPPAVTIWQAAAVPESQIFSLIGVLLLLPLVLAYTIFVYWTFRGKVSEGYH